MKAGNWLFRLDVLLVAICASYITLGIASPAQAEDLWAVYAGITFVLAILCVFFDGGHE